MVIVRENTEDLYAGLELMIMPGIAQSIKLITRRGARGSASTPSTTPSASDASG